MTEVGYENDVLNCVFDNAGLPIGGVTQAECVNTPAPTAPTFAPTALLKMRHGWHEHGDASRS